jgi:hypothetical protein
MQLVLGTSYFGVGGWGPVLCRQGALQRWTKALHVARQVI